ncbi:3-hydroxylacyl-ACP dehydratase [Cupriavidus sp. WKF15]|uniref:3-hydroxylacyl-ACP dehydratase n=1 Tax=Cupriavidus sp. WKF15 TaxID=3032282 RepID=UPI0023E17911|nr:3-hydroxylacyl-ACP dehydratase [Cupriavidus sp. WKF15]WER50129.1 3-hydroxylacyl-ACP dehydratase [Cupriavidus sp. WKF15]
MCLLDSVIDWDADFIRCVATSHHSADNPLRAHGRLAAVCGVEYAAQAMAAHGAASQQGTQRPRMGYLASVRKLVLDVDRLDDIDGSLTIEAHRISGEGANVLYAFEVSGSGKRLLCGRAAVILDVAPPPGA